MTVDKSRRHNHAVSIDGTRRLELRFVRIADENDAVAANAHIGFTRAAAGTVNDLAVNDQNIDVERWFDP